MVAVDTMKKAIFLQSLMNESVTGVYKQALFAVEFRTILNIAGTAPAAKPIFIEVRGTCR
ncbi:hypothetical protein SOASR029_17210 [Budvicia aquatica]|uniref:Uncharacterized protein n=1 Tax=Budvicia aquatica TaxID=82979 RepID=A0A2C6DKA6_9GAMM|nr:hypothetical protein CRN84_07980 [Budvicia aquatica]GKX51412.1 hypothetical protein SOASR029_17210 [Budvicia aquatica]